MKEFDDLFKIDRDLKVMKGGTRDLVRGGAPGAAAPGVFEDLLNEELQF